MSEQQRRKQQRRRRSPAARAADLWRPVRPIDDPEPITPARDHVVSTALLRSLGEPPLHGQGAVAERYLALVVEGAANLATALAAAGDLLADRADDEPDEAT